MAKKWGELTCRLPSFGESQMSRFFFPPTSIHTFPDENVLLHHEKRHSGLPGQLAYDTKRARGFCTARRKGFWKQSRKRWKLFTVSGSISKHSSPGLSSLYLRVRCEDRSGPISTTNCSVNYAGVEKNQGWTSVPMIYKLNIWQSRAH